MRLLLTGCVTGCLLVVGLSACDNAPTSTPTRSSSPSSLSHPTAPGAAVVTTHDNVLATRQFSSWLLHAVPMPPSAREWRHSPTSHYRQGSIGIGPSDPAFSRTTWWTVPATGDALDSWLRTHAPHGLKAESGSGGSVESAGVWEHDQDFRAPSTSAHSEGWVNFAFMPEGNGLVVRVDTFVGARFARTVLVPRDATSVTIRRTERSWQRLARRHASVRTVTDPSAVAQLVDMLDSLPGRMTTPFVASCPPTLTQRSYSMSFATPHGSYVATLPTTTCWPALTLAHDGVVVDPPLDPGQEFTKVADSHLE